jgi:sulfotransferase family protein
MYSFAELASVRVVDEPLYGHYLRVSAAEHPGRKEIMAAMNCDGDAVMQDLLQQQGQDRCRVLFMKHMAHHLLKLDLGFLQSTQNVFLIRDPREMLPSLTIQLPHAKIEDTGLQRQWELYSDLTDAGQIPIILDSRELLLDPEGVLRQLTLRLKLEFSNGMLTWRTGARAEDGVWAPHWYDAVHKSTGFMPYMPKSDFPGHLQPLLDECCPWYEKLYEQALRSNAGTATA